MIDRAQLWSPFLSSNQQLLIWGPFPGSCNRTVLFKKEVIFKLTFIIILFPLLVTLLLLFGLVNSCSSFKTLFKHHLPSRHLLLPFQPQKIIKSIKLSFHCLPSKSALFTSPYNMWKITIKGILLARWTTELERLFLMYHCVSSAQHNAWQLTSGLKLIWLNECSYSFCIRRGVRGKKYI